jgi:hypothetical protein
MRRQLFQGFFFILVYVAALVLREAEYENPAASPVRGDQRAKAATLALPRPGNPLLEQVAPRSASYNPLAISRTAAQRLGTVSPCFRAQRSNHRVV